ncbi:hypothetical protein CYFUS_009606 [Cystobacter fuscus]|uniref:Uncharacterized protein n=1 Tax=Cystobacter fuscus TaxID=43 RepID=A0A250JJR1_9BACT|nr:hypothetical protein [Cystobacter fuscus]ATB44125.1 hypothetical protein CYFUS_009606 [Cystobacter fuscus]
MSDEKESPGDRVGPYLLGERLELMGSGVGRLYLAHHVHTGARTVLLFPEKHLEGLLQSDWEVSLSGGREESSVKMKVERSDGPVPTKEVADALRLITQAIARVEDKERLYQHLLAKPVERRGRWGSRSGRVRAALVALAMVAVGLGVWLYAR